MGDPVEKSTMNAVVGLREQLKDMSKNMRLFSLSMRSLYTAKAVSMKAETSQKFRELRDDTRNDAMVYLTGILPLSSKFAASISDFFEYYEAMDFHKWCEKLSSILEETVGYKELCETILKMHEDILVPLKKRQDQAKLVVTECKGLQEKFEKKKKEYEEKAYTKESWAFGLSLVPGIGTIASNVLKENAEADWAEADAQDAQAEVQGAAAIAVRDTLIPALEHFIDGITKAAGFFSIMEQEIRKFEGKAEKGMDTQKRLHYTVMRREAQDMKSISQAFSTALPDVKSDFEAIPSEGTDQNYVDRCLKEHRGTIKATCTTSNLVSSLLVVTFTGGFAGTSQLAAAGAVVAGVANVGGGLLPSAQTVAISPLLSITKWFL